MVKKQKKYILKYKWTKREEINNENISHRKEKIIKKENYIKLHNNIYKNNLIEKRIRLFYIIIFEFIIINSLIGHILSYGELPNLNITWKINGIGSSKIYNGLKPSQVYINGNKLTNINDKYYYFNQTENYVQLIWNYDILSCSDLFRGCSNITEIDLSNFDTSKVTDIKGMFYNCSSLTSLNLSNINTSKVTNMDDLFAYCSSLTSLKFIYFWYITSYTYEWYVFRLFIIDFN